MERRRRDIVDAANAVNDGDGVILLTDMFGGTPSNLAISVIEETHAEVIAGLLRVRGHEVVHVLHGLGALSEIATDGFDVGLLDFDLPALDGTAIARQLRTMGYELPLVAVTARSDAYAETQVLAAGFDGFLRKPVTGDLLVAAIAQARAKRQATA